MSGIGTEKRVPKTQFNEQCNKILNFNKIVMFV